MSFMTQGYIVDKFGLRLTMEQLAECIGIAVNTIYNQVAKGVFPVKTYRDGKQRWADYRDVAQYLDDCRASAATQA